MPHPSKVDPMNPTWVIAVDFKLDKLKSFCENESRQDPSKECQKLLNGYRTQIFNTFYEIVAQYDFRWRMQNSLVFNNSSDATKAFKAVSLGIKKSWIKYFIEKIHLFEIDPNSDASDLLELNTKTHNNPEWMTEKLIEHLSSENDLNLDNNSLDG